MSLQVWLPLNGSLENNRLSNVTTSISSTEFLEGKIGKYSLNIKNSQFKININNNIITPSNGISISMWLKIKVTDSIIDSQEVWQNVLWMNYLDDSIERFEISRIYLLKWQTQPYIDEKNVLQSSNDYSFRDWKLVTYIILNNTIKIYVNGNYVSQSTFNRTSSNITSISFNKNNTNTYDILINDFRIYDHCLSTKEVKEIAKGLVLHYKLDNNGLGNSNVCCRNYSTQCPNLTSEWYTGKWKLETVEDNGHCTKLTQLAISDSGSNGCGRHYSYAPKKALTHGKTYTFSVYIKTNKTMNLWIGPENKNTGWTSVTTTTEWNKYTYTFIANNDATYESCIFYRQKSTDEEVGDWIEIRNLKIEEGDKATPWTPSVNESLYKSLGCSSTIIKDSSGYNNHGNQVIQSHKNLIPINNLIQASGNYKPTSATYDNNTNKWTIVSPAQCTNAWGGTGLEFPSNAFSVPYGEWYSISFEVYSEVDIKIKYDFNNNVESGTAWNGCDNDLISARSNDGNIINVPAKTYKRLFFKTRNYSSDNTNKINILPIDRILCYTADVTSPVTWYVRNVKVELGSYATSPLVEHINVSSDTPRYLASTVLESQKDKLNIKPFLNLNQLVNEITLSCWCKVSTDLYATGPALISLGDNSFIRYRISNNHVLVHALYGDGTLKSTDWINASPTNLKDNKWHHYVTTFKNGVIKLYVDGRLLSATDYSSISTSLKVGSTNFTIGNNVYEEPLIGSFSDVRVYMTALSDEDIKSLYNTSVSIDKNGNMYAKNFIEEEV